MPWVRLDEAFAQHPKVAAAGPLAIALQVAGLCYCNQNLTDGFIPRAVARTLVDWQVDREDGRVYTVGVTCGMSGNDLECEWVIDLMLERGIWIEAPGGYRIHDYLDYQPSKAQVLAEREQKRAAGRKGGLASSQGKQAPAQALALAPAQAESKPVPVPVTEPQGTSPLQALAKDQLSSEILDIYEHWRRAFHKTDKRYDKITPARRSKIATRRREGFTAAELKGAITNAANDPWDERAKHNDLTLILRSSEKVQYFLELPAASRRSAPPASRENAAAYRSFS